MKRNLVDKLLEVLAKHLTTITTQALIRQKIIQAIMIMLQELAIKVTETQ